MSKPLEFQGALLFHEATWQNVKGRFETETRGAVEVKHKGLVDMYFLNRIKPEFSS